MTVETVKISAGTFNAMKVAFDLHPVLIEALQSIAKNTCCEGCQEAAIVARAALAKATGAA